MTDQIGLTFLLVFFAGAISLVMALAIAALPWARKNLGTALSSFAAGVLLATAFVHLLPEAVESGLDIEHVGWAMFAAVAGFFVLERLTVWFHHHHDVKSSVSPSVVRVLLGDGLHNMIDGFAIATTAIADWRLGVLTAVAIAAHEIPQEMADFTVLLRSGMKPVKALLWNVASALTAFAGAFFGLFLEQNVASLVPYGLAASAGMFLYIALSDLIPALHEHDGKEQRSRQLTQLLLFFGGVLMLQAVESVLGIWLPEAH